jgi:ABC-2 type transport system ATP-binding protein
VAQVTIQKCLKEYNAHRGVTMLLTSHYMRDVEALCRRVLVITHGRLIYDGALSGITEQFGRSKLVNLQFPGEAAPEGLEEYGEVTERAGPSASLKVERGRVAEVLAAILDRYTVLDMSVQDPPLDQVIAKVFQQAELSNGDGEKVKAADERVTTGAPGGT